MNRRSAVVSLCLIGFLWSVSGATAAPVASSGQNPVARDASRQGRPVSRAASELTDEATGTAMRLTRLRSGALQIDLESGNLEVRKTLHANGDFELVLRAEGDLFTAIRRGEHVRVGRHDRSVGFGARSIGDAELDQLQEVMAGSAAIRRFRALKSMLSPSSRHTVLGSAFETIDLIVGVLRGESPTLVADSTAPATAAMAFMDNGDDAEGPTCYASWKDEVVSAWGDLKACQNSFAWYNPTRELCGFEWVLRVESAWFKFLGCSAVPIKME